MPLKEETALFDALDEQKEIMIEKFYEKAEWEANEIAEKKANEKQFETQKEFDRAYEKFYEKAFKKITHGINKEDATISDKDVLNGTYKIRNLKV